MLMGCSELGRQVEKSHYEFARYVSKERWASFWHQIDEIIKLNPRNVLEVGPGPGLFKAIAKIVGIDVETLDLDPDLSPDHIGSATDMPFSDGTYDVVCAFQMLEHLPYDVSLKAFRDMIRVSVNHVVISLPDARPLWHYKLYVPKIGQRDFAISRPQLRLPLHKFNGEHYWEINKRDYPLARIVADYTNFARLVKTYRVPENPYHRFFVFEK
jgi:SAM-dependent methyltransferase